MQREWNPKSFFRNLTPDVIELFTKSVGLTVDVAVRKAAGAQLFAAWKALPADQQQKLAMFEAARDWSAQDLALRLFLDDPRAFEDAHKDYVVDTMSNGKEYRGRAPSSRCGGGERGA